MRISSLILVCVLAISFMPMRAFAYVYGDGIDNTTLQVGVSIYWNIYSNQSASLIVISSGTLPDGIKFDYYQTSTGRVTGTALPGTVGDYPVSIKDGISAAVPVTYSVQKGPQTIAVDYGGNTDVTDIYVPVNSTPFTLDVCSIDGNGDKIDVQTMNPTFFTTQTLIDDHQPAYTFSVDNGTSVSVDASGQVTLGATGDTVININSSTTDSYEAATQKQITIHVLALDQTPNATIDYTAEELTGLDASKGYTIDGSDKSADGNGKIAIDESWMDNAAHTIVLKGDGTTIWDSLPQSLNILARPSMPSVTAIQPSVIGGTGGIDNTTAAMEYSTDHSVWTTCSAGSTTGLAADTYYVRVKATATSFASTEVTVTLNSFTAATPTLTLSASPVNAQTYPGNVTLTATLAGAAPDNSGKTIAFTVNSATHTVTTDASGVATYTVSSPNPGTYNFGATFAGDTQNSPATATAITGYTVELGAQAALYITGLGNSYTYGDNTFTLSTSGGSGSGAVTYMSSDPAVASVSGSTVTILKAGTFTITATKAADSIYAEASVTSSSVTVNQANPTVTLTGANVSFGENVTLEVTVSGAGTTPDGTVTFMENGVDISGAITLSGGVASFTTATYPSGGDHNYSVAYSGQPDYYNSGSDSITVGVGKTDQTGFAIIDPGAITYGDSGISLTAAGGQSTGGVTFSVQSNNAVSITSGGALTINNAGTVTVTATKAGDTNYNSITAELEITINPRSISNVSATVTGSVVYTGSQLQPAFSVSDGVLAIDTGDYYNEYGTNLSAGADSGSITLTGQRNYTGTKTVDFAISKATPPTIIFPTTATVTYDPGKTLTDVTLSGGSGDGTFAWQTDAIVPTPGNSGYMVQFTPRDTDNYDYSGITLTETVALTVDKAEQVITGLQNLVKINGGDDFTVTPGSNAAAENPNISFQSSNVAVIDFDASGNFVIKGDGTTTITVLADETDNYKAATATFEIRVLANTASLEEVIAAAEDLIDDLQTDDIGNGDGQYPQDAVDDLRDAIDAAKAVANDTNATQAEVDAAKEALLKAIEEFQNSLIAVDFTALDDAITAAGSLNEADYTVGSWQVLQTALAAGKTVRGTANVTQAEADAAAKAINDAISALYRVYVFITTFDTFTGSGSLTAKVDAPYSNFERLLINGKEVDSSNYTVAEGSTVITLKEAYLKTLVNGTYTVTAEFTDGFAETTLKVAVTAATSTGTTTTTSTGDDFNIWLWITLIGASLLGIAGIVLTRKRKLYGGRRGK